MKNLTLKLDDLQIESFQTTIGGGSERGTVLGLSLGPPPKPAHPNDDDTSLCVQETYSCDCPSDWATCDYCYESGNMWQCTNDTCGMAC